jgi:hypothetical protein
MKKVVFNCEFKVIDKKELLFFGVLREPRTDNRKQIKIIKKVIQFTDG